MIYVASSLPVPPITTTTVVTTAVAVVAALIPIHTREVSHPLRPDRILAQAAFSAPTVALRFRIRRCTSSTKVVIARVTRGSAIFAGSSAVICTSSTRIYWARVISSWEEKTEKYPQLKFVFPFSISFTSFLFLLRETKQNDRRFGTYVVHTFSVH